MPRSERISGHILSVQPRRAPVDGGIPRFLRISLEVAALHAAITSSSDSLTLRHRRNDPAVLGVPVDDREVRPGIVFTVQGSGASGACGLRLLRLRRARTSRANSCWSANELPAGERKQGSDA